jgi:hypothetical protein
LLATALRAASINGFGNPCAWAHGKAKIADINNDNLVQASIRFMKKTNGRFIGKKRYPIGLRVLPA